MFEPAVEPFVASTCERVDQLVRELGHAFDDGERSVLARSFRESVSRELSARLARVLVLELNLARIQGTLSASEPSARLREFIDRASTAEARSALFRTYPNLKDRVDVFVRNAGDAHVEMARRMAADREMLSVSFGVTGRLAGLDVGMGDRHRRGRTVNSVRFDDGKLVYKPRSLAVDVRLAALVDRLGDGVEQVSLGVPRSVDRGAYGWAEFVEYRQCDTEQDVRHFYRSMGALLAVMRLLRGTDMHAENIIASGRTPVVVDCETLFSPLVLGGSELMSEADRVLWASLAPTIAASFILPGDPFEGTDVDLSALGFSVGSEMTVRLPRIAEENADTAHVVEDDVTLAKNNTCAPMPSVQPADYLDELLDGFRLYVDRIGVLGRSSMLHGTLRGFEDCELRFVPRDTKFYMDLMRTLWHPAAFYQQDDTVDQISRLLASDDVVDMFPLPSQPETISAEINDLLAGDVPYFALEPADGAITGPDGVPVATFGNLVDEALEQWHRIDQGLEEQLIKTAMVSARRVSGVSGHRRVEPSEGSDDGHLVAKPVTELIEGIAREICARATRGDDGSVNWIGTVVGRKGISLGPLNRDLYGGLPGMMVALAAYETAQRAELVPAIDDVTDLLERCVRSIVRGRGAVDRAESANGAYCGPASRVHAWLLGYRILGDDRLLEHALRATDELRSHVAATESSDVMTGLAGAMAMLVNVHQFVRDDLLLEDAISIAETLEMRTIEETDGTVHWHTDGHDRGGFAHGVTGIGWALSRLALATGEHRWHRLAMRAFAFDVPMRVAESGTDEPMSPRLSTTWCYGVSGVGLAHADLARVTVSDYHSAEAGAAVREIMATPLTGSHSLCHGDLSCAELVYQRADDQTMRQSYVDSVYRDLSVRGPHVGETGDAYTPSLMDGLAGVLYQLVRLTVGDAVPSIFTPFVERL